MANDIVNIEENLPVQQEDKEFLGDLEYARKNQIELVEQGIKGLEGIINVADQSQHPRAYEVLSTYLRTMAELNRELVTTSEKKRDTKQSRSKGPESVTNNLFVGSTKDLQEMLKKTGS